MDKKRLKNIIMIQEKNYLSMIVLSIFNVFQFIEKESKF